MIATVPFHEEATTTVGARVGPDGIEHLLPPSITATSSRRRAAFGLYHFGGDLLRALKDAGFKESWIYVTYSRKLGYLLRGHVFSVAIK
jgi:hypothetical protein